MSAKKKDSSVTQMLVSGILIDPAIQAPVILLKNLAGDVQIPIWIGMSEATSIAATLKKLSLNRPLTHDLFITVLEELGAEVEQVLITSIKNGTYYAEVVLSQGEKAIILDCRPSDAIGLAIRSDAPIFVNNEVLKVAQENAQPIKGGSIIDSPDAKEENQKIKDLRYVDKSKWAEILEDLDTEDFKYKV